MKVTLWITTAVHLDTQIVVSDPGSSPAKAHAWLNQSNLLDGDCLRVEGPGRDMVTDARVKKLESDPAIRGITSNFGTHSTDSRLLFERGTSETIARSSWGQKIKKKLEKRQAGLPGAQEVGILVIDFTRADTGSPDFICWPKIADKLSETVSFLVKGIPGPASYDMILPARLSFECCFSRPIWIDESKAQQGEVFIQKARLNRPCVEVVQDQIPLIDRLIQGGARN